jgi:chemotaxis protein CheX
VDHVETASGAWQPIGDECRSHLLEPFIEATRAALAEMAATDVVVRGITRADRFQAQGDVLAVVQLASTTDGYLALGFPRRTATGLAERVFAGVLQTVDEELLCDCMGEIANVIAGQAKTLLAATPYQFTFTLPRVTVGYGPDPWPHTGRDWLVAVLGTELGEIAIQLLYQQPTTSTT